MSAAPFTGLVADTTLAYTYRSSFVATPPDDDARDSAAAAAALPGEPNRRTLLIAHVSPATSGRSGRAASNLASRGRTTAPGSPLALAADASSPCAVSTGTSESRDDESSRTFPPNAAVVASIAFGSTPVDAAAWTNATSAAVAVPSSPTPNADATAREQRATRGCRGRWGYPAATRTPSPSTRRESVRRRGGTERDVKASAAV